ncbi:MAG: hypothetical protein M3Q45_14810, partial [Chloroflexota bacterium]|nr:hypothetical protein [Chloroflexota bacterium]
TVFLNGVAVPATVINSGQLTALLTLSAIGQAQSVSVSVLNPGPAGGASNAALFSVQAGVQAGVLLFLPAVMK